MGQSSGPDVLLKLRAGIVRFFFEAALGGHAPVAQVALDAVKYEIKRLVFAHIGRPTIRAIDAGKQAAFGEFGTEGFSQPLACTFSS
jgi:hypothetical protein